VYSLSTSQSGTDTYSGNTDYTMQVEQNTKQHLYSDRSAQATHSHIKLKHIPSDGLSENFLLFFDRCCINELETLCASDRYRLTLPLPAFPIQQPATWRLSNCMCDDRKYYAIIQTLTSNPITQRGQTRSAWP